MKRMLGIVLLLPIFLLIGITTYKDISFKIDCGGHIKRAADANTVELAIQEMETVTTYLEREGMTSGYASILYRTPDEDVGFWYANLKSSLNELKKVRPETSQLERSNLLLKLRETLLDRGGQGDEKITAPHGISRYPNNVGFALLGILSLVLIIPGMICLFLE